MYFAPRRELDAREMAKIALGKKISDGVKRAYARRYAERIAPHILTLLAEIGRAEIDNPATWYSFVPEDIRTRWPSVAHSLGMLADIHRDWPYHQQELWFRTLLRTASACREAARERAAKTKADPIPDEDAAALASLGDLA